jgi:hypothetical protein
MSWIVGRRRKPLKAFSAPHWARSQAGRPGAGIPPVRVNIVLATSALCGKLRRNKNTDMPPAAIPDPPARSLGPFFLYLLCLVGALAFLFSPSFSPEQAHTSNDSPLGISSAESFALPQGYSGQWFNLNWLGISGGAAVLNVNTVVQWLLGPVGFAKWLPFVSCLMLGLCAWLFFRQCGFAAAVSGLAGLAAALNMNFFSNACWGLGQRAMTLALLFLALAAIVSPAMRAWWLKAILAGLAVGLVVAEGVDVGAIYSLYAAAFAFFCLFNQPGASTTTGARVTRAIGLVAIMAACATLTAYPMIRAIIDSGVKVTVGQEDKTSPEERWNFTTQWSTPKLEALRVIIPGLFGYRLDAVDGGNYWGAVGQDPRWPTAGWPRHNGSGEYAGLLVVVVALWAAAQSFRGAASVFQPAERRAVSFWGVAAAISLLLAFGRHAPFYQIIYKLPYFSTIRNPMKFMHPFHLALMLLFAHGLQGLSRAYLDRVTGAARGVADQLKAWWKNARGFDKRWAIGSVLAVIASVMAWMLYGSAKPELIRYLGANAVPVAPETIAQFSLSEVRTFVFLLVVTLGLLACVMAGVFGGARAKWAWLLMGVLLALDLGRANAHWIVYYNYQERYAGNPLIEFLRQKPHEQRVGILPYGGGELLNVLRQFYGVDLAQHHFPYNNIQSIDIIQMPRQPEDYRAYLGALGNKLQRYWQLTNTRYFLGPAGMADRVNADFDPEQKRFRQVQAFTLKPAGSYPTVETNGTGPFALFGFGGALPRARLYGRWETLADEPALARLADAKFDPTASVLLADSTTVAAAAADAKAEAGAVNIVSYSPKRILLKANAAAPAVLLLNERHEPNWKLRVDGQPAPLLRCNYLMRGAFLSAGDHTVEFSFEPPTGSRYISFAGIGLGLLLCGVVIFRQCRRPAAAIGVTPLPVAKPPAQR